MSEQDKTWDTILHRAVPLRDRIITWMDPISMKPEQRRARRRSVIITAVIITILTFVISSLTAHHITNRCAQAAAGVIMYDVPSAASIAHSDTRRIAKVMLEKYPQAREIDFCTGDDGNIVQKFLSASHH